MDLSQFSDEELMRAAGGGVGKAPAAAMDLSQFSDEELMKAAGMDTAAPVQPETAPKDFFQRLGDDFDERRAKIENIRIRQKLWQPYTDVAKPGEYRGQGLNDISGALQQLGQYVGGGFDILGEGALSLYNAIPESVKDNAVTRTVGEAYKSKFLPGEISPADVVNTVGQTVGAGYEAARQYAPDTVANLEAIAAIAPVTQAAGRGVGAVGTLGKAIESSGVRAASEKTLGLAKDIVSPKETAKTKAGQIRVEKGWNRKQEVVDSRLDEIARDVAPIIDENPGKSLLWYENAIRDANVLEAEKLKSSLMKSDAVISDDTILKGLQGAQENLNELAWIQEGGKNSTQQVIEIAQKIIDSKPKTPAGMLEARIEFDKVITGQMPNVFDSVRDAPIKAAVKEVRNFMNKTVADAVPDEGVRESLRRQNNMFIAVDNIAPKRAALPDTRVGRAFKSAQDVVSLKGAILGTAAAGGLGLGAAPVILPAAGLYGAYRVAASPTTRKLVGQALQAPEKVLQAPSKLKQRLTKQDLQAAFEAKKGINTPEQMLALPAPQTTVFVDKNGVGVPLTQADREIIGSGFGEPYFQKNAPQAGATVSARAATKPITKWQDDLSPRTKRDLENPASYVVRNKETGEVVREISPNVLPNLNTDKYEAVPVIEHLANLNGQSYNSNGLSEIANKVYKLFRKNEKKLPMTNTFLDMPGKKSQGGQIATLHHGTNIDFTKLDPEKSGGMVFFGEDPFIAKRYAEQSGGNRARLSDLEKYIVGDNGIVYELTGAKTVEKTMTFKGERFNYEDLEGGEWSPIGRANPNEILVNKKSLLPLDRKYSSLSMDEAKAATNPETGTAELIPKSSKIITKDFENLKLLDISTPEGRDVIVKLNPTTRIGQALVDAAKYDAKSIDNSTTQLNNNFWQFTKSSKSFGNQLAEDIVEPLKKLGYDGVRFKDDQHKSIGLFDSGLEKEVNVKNKTINEKGNKQ